MALNNFVVSVIIFFFVLSGFTGEAHISSTPAGSPGPFIASLPGDFPVTYPGAGPGCPKEYIKLQSEGMSAKTEEFLKYDIIRRLDDNTLVESDRECLIRCFQGYQSALAFIEKAMTLFSERKYRGANENVIEFYTAISATMNCKSEVILRNPEFLGMRKWVESILGDIPDKLVMCTY